MKRLIKFAFAGLIGLFAINVWAGLVVSTVSKNAIITPAVPATYTYDANASYGLWTGTYRAEWNNMKYICKSQGVPAVKEWISNTNGYYNEWYFPDGWYTNVSLSAQIQSDLRYDVFYGHPPGEVNQFRCQNITEGGTNSYYRYVQVGGTTYYCSGLLNAVGSRITLLQNTCNGSTCKVFDKFSNTARDFCSAIKRPEPEPEPVIVNNPCPAGSSSMSTGGKRMADSTGVAGSLCAQKLTIGFDANGVANSLITEHSTSSTQSISAAASFANSVRQGNSDSTNIGSSLPNTVNYSDFTLGNNSNGQTQLQGASTGTATVR